MFNLAKDIFSRLLHSLSFKLSFTAGLIIFLAVSAAAWFNIRAQQSQLEKTVETEASSFVDTVRRATYWSMLKNQRESLHQIIQDVGHQPGIEREKESGRLQMDEAKNHLLRLGFADDQIHIKYIEKQKSIPKQIIDEVKAGQYGTVVVGRRGENNIKNMLFGSVSGSVIGNLTGATICVVE